MKLVKYYSEKGQASKKARLQFNRETYFFKIWSDIKYIHDLNFSTQLQAKVFVKQFLKNNTEVKTNETKIATCYLDNMGNLYHTALTSDWPFVGFDMGEHQFYDFEITFEQIKRELGLNNDLIAELYGYKNTISYSNSSKKPLLEKLIQEIFIRTIESNWNKKALNKEGLVL